MALVTGWRRLFAIWAAFCLVLLLGEVPRQDPSGPCPGDPYATTCVRTVANPLGIGPAGTMMVFVAGLVALIALRAVLARRAIRLGAGADDR